MFNVTQRKKNRGGGAINQLEMSTGINQCF